MSEHRSKEEVLSSIGELPFLEPSYLIDSGHGYHLLWLFREALEVGKEISIEEYERTNGTIQDRLGADHTKDISRILRLPGSINVKNPEKPVSAAIIRESDMRYEYDDFIEALSLREEGEDGDRPKNVEISREHLEEIKKDFNDRFYNRRFPKLTRRIASIIRYGTDPDDPTNTNRSCLIQSAVDSMIVNNYAYSEVYAIITDERNKISEKVLEKESEEMRKDYVALSIAKAEGYLEQNVKSDEEIPESEMNYFENYFRDVDVIGRTSETDIVLYYRKRATVKPLTLEKLTNKRIMLLWGIENTQENRQLMQRFENVVIQRARSRGMIDLDSKISSGIHWIDGSFFLLSKTDILQIDPEKNIVRREGPMIGDRLIDCSSDTRWLDVDYFMKAFPKANLSDVYSELYDYVNQWNWEDSEMTSYMTAMMMVTPFHLLMKWRPWVYIMAKRGYGKSFFFKYALEKFFGGLAVRLDKTSAYALGNAINGSGKIPLLDDFEKDRRNAEVINSMKIANQGGKKNLGRYNSSNLTFDIKHMFYFNSILNSLTDAAAKSRSLIFRLKNSSGNKFKYRSDEEFGKLLARSVAATIKNWEAIEKRASEIRSASDNRNIHNIAYCVALLEIVSEKQIEEFPEFVYSSEESEDEIKLLRTILETLTVLDSGASDRFSYDKFPAVEILKDHPHGLVDKGLDRTTIRETEKEYLAISASRVKRNFLGDTEYRFQDIREYLRNLPGSFAKQHVKLGINAIYFPWEEVMKMFPDK
jgi:hypothetical protein